MTLNPLHHAEWMYIRHVVFRISCWIAGCSILANFLPAASRLKNHPVLREFYEIAITLVAALAFNWRAEIPSLDGEFLGFQSRWRHRRRNRLQERIDRDYKH